MLLAIDTETSLATDAEPVPRLVSVAMAVEGGSRLWAAHESTIERALDEAFRHTTVFANAPFDVFVLLRAFPSLWPVVLQAYEDGRIKDVLTREKLIDIAEGEHRKRGKYSLAAVAERRAGITLDKSEDTYRLRYAELLGLEISQWPAAAIEYAIKDATTTLAVYRAQEEISAEVFRPADDNTRAHLVLYAQTLQGILTDQEMVDRLDARLLAEIEKYTAVCMQHGLAKYKHKKKRPSPIVCSKKAAAAMLQAIPGVRLSYAEKGGISLSEDALITAGIPDGHPLDSYRRLLGTRTQRTGWVTPLRAPIIRTRYDECVGTGRTSSSEPGDPWVGRNLQNFPQKGGYRECLMPPPGHVFDVSDFGALELVTLAQTQLDWFGYSTLADALRAGRDPHSEMGARLLGIPYESFNKEIPQHGEKRKLAKALNFGLPGGLGAARFVEYAAREPYEITLTEDESRALKQIWLEQWPDMRDYFARINSLKTYDDLYTVVEGRSGHIRGRVKYTDACNFSFQCLGAYVMKRALWRLFVSGIRTVLVVHDEAVSVAPIADAERVLAKQEQIMKAAAAELCPDVPIKVESGVMERYRKL